MPLADRKTGTLADSQALIAELVNWFETWPRDAGALGDDLRMTGALHPYDYLFSSITVGRLNLKNRLVMGPMGNLSMADAAGRPTSKVIAYFEARARGGTGLLVSGLVPASPASDPAIGQFGGFAWFPRMGGTRGVAAGWRDLAESVHAHGSRFCVQPTAGLGRVG